MLRTIVLFLLCIFSADIVTMATPGRCHCDCSRAYIRRLLHDNILLVAILTSVVLGVMLGLGIRQLNPSYEGNEM